MRAYVVYESFFGNTAQVAEAIAEGLRSGCEVEIAEVGRADPDPGAELLVIGGPTHMWGISRWFTRSGARRQARVDGHEPPSKGRSLRAWIKEATLPAEARVAVFDTAVRRTGRMPTGSAARGLAKRLERRGYELCVPPAQFYVTSVNRLEDGERERAEGWGRELATLVGAAA
jgi:hypothetical protein